MSDMGDVLGPIAGAMIVSEVAGILMLAGGVVLVTLLFWRSSFVWVRVLVGGGLLLAGVFLMVTFDPGAWTGAWSLMPDNPGYSCSGAPTWGWK